MRLVIGIRICLAEAKKQSLVPAMLAVTPGVLFLSAVNNPSGLEICAAIALWATAPLVFREGTMHKSETFGFAVSGVMLITVRPLGTVLYLCVLFGCAVHDKARFDARQIIAKLKTVWSVHIVAMIFSVGWYLRVFSVNTSEPVTAGNPSLGLGSKLSRAFNTFQWCCRRQLAILAGWTPRCRAARCCCTARLLAR